MTDHYVRLEGGPLHGRLVPVSRFNQWGRYPVLLRLAKVRDAANLGYFPANWEGSFGEAIYAASGRVDGDTPIWEHVTKTELSERFPELSEEEVLGVWPAD